MSNATLRRIDAQLEQLPRDSLRHRLLTALRQFRAGWIDLGRLLNQVAFDGDYKEWGYEDFDLYCARELGLKRPTVQKLMVSYNYMRKHEPERLHAFEDAAQPGADAHANPPDIPDFQTVELLDRARRRSADGQPGLGEQDVDTFHRRVFQGGGAPEGLDPDDESRLRKELRERLRPVRPAAPESARERAALLRAARALRERLAAAPGLVPAELRQRLDNDLAELETLEEPR